MNLERRFRVPGKGFALGDCDPDDRAGVARRRVADLIAQAARTTVPAAAGYGAPNRLLTPVSPPT